MEFVFTFSTIPFQLIEPLNSIEYSARRRRTRCIKNVLPEDGTYEKVTSISPKTHQANSAELPLELLHLLAIAKKMAFCHDITALYSSVDYILSRLICFLAIDCGTLAVPMNGSFKGTRTYFPNVLQFSCDEGFILGGATERQCLADGSWSGNDTSCKGLIVQKKRKKELTKLNA